MPVTPLHIGIPGLLSHYKPAKIEIVAVILGSVLVDLDFFFYLGFGTELHGFLHTFIGATLLGGLLALSVHIGQPVFAKLKEWFIWEEGASLKSILTGAMFGSYSHILLDMWLYRDVQPFYPMAGNPFYYGDNIRYNFLAIYLLSGITTLAFLALYMVKVYQNQKSQNESE